MTALSAPPHRGFTVALIGADGAGKTTVAAALDRRLPMAVHYLYMGVNAEAANQLLPTTLLVRAIKRAVGAEPDAGGPPDPAASRPPPSRGRRKRVGTSLRGALRLANQMAEEAYRQLLARSHVRRGSVVVLDRDFYADYHAYDVVGGPDRPLGGRVHGFFLTRLYRKPDLAIYLDAPGAVLFARKGEGTVDALERRRVDYLALSGVLANFCVVDAAQPLEQVVDEVVQRIEGFAGPRAGAGAGSSGRPRV